MMPLNSYELRTLEGIEKRYFTCRACNTTFEIATVEEIEERYGKKVDVIDEGTSKNFLFTTADNENIFLICTKGLTFEIFGHMCLCKTCNRIFPVREKNVSYKK